MNTRILFTIAISFLLAVDASAQASITSKYNGYRDGDKLYRIIADSVSLGNSGHNCLWKLPAAQNDDNYMKQAISLRNDSLTIVENDVMLHYVATDTALSMCGFQTREMLSVYDRLLPELRFPFAYGDSIADTFSCRTTYYNTLTIHEEGYCYTVCDGMGILTDGSESMKDVLRVHHHVTSLSSYENVEEDSVENVTSEVTEDKFLWYYAGCRYPVMDTRVIKCKTNGEVVSDTTFTSLYMPDLQLSELAYDDANSQLIAQRNSNEHFSDSNGSDNQKPFPITMSATLQPNHTEIALDYFVAEETDATFYACDMAGRLLGCVTHLSLSEGEHHETMLLKNRPINSIVMLTMVVGDRQEVIKVR